MQELTEVQKSDVSEAPLAVEMRHIHKAWPGVIANDDVNFSVRQGEIHALVGENGAGKTTLMNILYGLVKPTSGEVLIDEKPTHISGPRDAIRLGIGMVHQHFMLIPPLTVAENIVLGYEPGGVYSPYRQQETLHRIDELTRQYGLHVDPGAITGQLSVGQQQRVEILKVLYRGARLLIMDEPTGVLTPQETHELFAVLRGLVAQGKTIIFITHKLREVLELSDRVTVLRRGKVVGNLITRETSQEEIARLMVGRDVLLRVDKPPAKPGEVLLRVENITADSERGLAALRGVSFDVRAGEILGIAGVEGNGQSELVEVITGLRRATGGKVELGDRDVTNLSARQVRRAGLAHIPEDRRGSGLVLGYSIDNNLILGRQRWTLFSINGILLRFKQIVSWAVRLIREFDIRAPGPTTLVKALSGGNQQKIIVAREMSSEPKVLVASQPTRGVDIGAIEFIHRRLVAQRDAGVAILLVSAELDEIRSLSDRIAVMYEGHIVGVESPEVSEERLGLLMAGAEAQQVGAEVSKQAGASSQQIEAES
ncbi:MAG TPA: ABC transporter ATP-binding protein [Ktedonobacterales bacterium]|jgi:simple sugar transport system ATP-binding protein